MSENAAVNPAEADAADQNMPPFLAALGAEVLDRLPKEVAGPVWELIASRNVWRNTAYRLESERDAATTRAETAERELDRQRKANRDVAKQCMDAMEQATTAKRELAELRERIGEAEVEWYVRWPTAGGDYHYELCLDEADARESVPDGDEACEVVSRVVGEWKAADDG